MLTKVIHQAQSSFLKALIHPHQKRHLGLHSRSLFNKVHTSNQIHYSYHMSYLLDSKNSDIFVKVDPPAFKLYKNHLITSPTFNEKYLAIIIVDSYRTKQPLNIFSQLIDYSVKNINQIQSPVTIASISAQIYLYNYQNRQNNIIIAKKFFELLIKQKQKAIASKKWLQQKKSTSNRNHKYFNPPTMKQNFTSYQAMKVLIFIEKMISLDYFTEEQYRLINYHEFKALYLCFTLEMFYSNKLQKWPLFEEILNHYIKDPSIIPFNDLHHMKKALQIIKDDRYKDFVVEVDNLYTDKMRGKNSDGVQDSRHGEGKKAVEGEEKQSGGSGGEGEQNKTQMAGKKQLKSERFFDCKKAYVDSLKRKYRFDF